MEGREELNNWVKRVEGIKGKAADLSLEEDLSIAVMNLISIEEHLYFSGMKTSKKDYLSLLSNVRELRKRLLKELVKEPEGEVWCLSKHFLSASMRLIEVGNKQLSKDNEKAYSLFQDAFYLYSLFWAVNMKPLEKGELIKEAASGKSRIIALVKKAIDCCKE